MRLTNNRCRHCNAPYQYQASGSHWVVDEDTNDDEYCPDCYTVIKNALSVIPVRRVYEWHDVTDVTYEELKAFEETKKINSPFPLARRVYAHTVDQEGWTTGIEDFVGFNHKEYHAIYKKRGSEMKNLRIQKKVERDNMTGKIIGDVYI